mgnify:CR=1 FL=1
MLPGGRCPPDPPLGGVAAPQTPLNILEAGSPPQTPPLSLGYPYFLFKLPLSALVIDTFFIFFLFYVQQ